MATTAKTMSMMPLTMVVALACAAALPRAVESQILTPAKVVTVGYHADARPFSFENESGKPVGYGVEVCRAVIEAARGELGGLAGAEVSWVPVSPATRLPYLREGKIQMICGEAVTVAARKDASFSIPIFQGGVSALLRADAPPELARALSVKSAMPDDLARLAKPTVAVVAGTPTEEIVAEALAKLQLSTTFIPVQNYAAGVQAVIDRKASVFFADRSILLDAMRRSPSFAELKVIDRRLTLGPVAIALPRGSEDARLAVDRALSRLYGTAEFHALYVKWFGEPDADTAAFFRLAALPE